FSLLPRPLSLPTFRAIDRSFGERKRDFSAAVTPWRSCFNRDKSLESFRTKRATSSATRKPSRARLQLASKALNTGRCSWPGFIQPPDLSGLADLFDQLDHRGRDGLFAEHRLRSLLHLGW